MHMGRLMPAYIYTFCLELFFFSSGTNFSIEVYVNPLVIDIKKTYIPATENFNRCGKMLMAS